MKSLFAVAFSILLLFGSTLSANAVVPRGSKHICGAELDHGLRYRWCIDLPEKNPAPGVVLYFFHGMMGSEQSWTNDFNQQEIQRVWREENRRVPAVISISFGPAWLMTKLPWAGHPSRYHLIARKVAKQIESKLPFRVVERRLYGESMGGFNASQLLLRNTGAFSRAALICAAFNDLGPFATDEKVQNFVSSHPFVNSDLINLMLTFSRNQFKTDLNWIRHDPLLLVKARKKPLPELFMTAWVKDDYGFLDGDQIFAERARALGTKVSWNVVTDGGHCQHTAESIRALAEFLTK